MQHLQPKTTLQGGKYRIERVLGQGGFGNTYVGYNTEFEETVAIKEFFMKGVTERDETTSAVSVSNADNVQQFEEQREKFKKEARRLRKLKNEHIVKVHDLFEENGTAYYVMDYIDGESLAERLKRTGKTFSEEDVRDILPQVLEALEEVHGNEIWHLDLKPGNIMIDKTGKVYLIDFGASKQIRANGSMTTSTALCYTPGYAPNEQIGQMFDRFGPWTDIYALGATIYNLLTNKKPPMAIDIEEDEDDAFSFPESVSKDFRKLVVWMMQPKRKARPQRIGEVAEKFATFQTVGEMLVEENKMELESISIENPNSTEEATPIEKPNSTEEVTPTEEPKQISEGTLLKETSNIVEKAEEFISNEEDNHTILVVTNKDKKQEPKEARNGVFLQRAIKVGDYIFDDGTYSDRLDDGEKAIGVLFSYYGGTHGQLLSAVKPNDHLSINGKELIWHEASIAEWVDVIQNLGHCKVSYGNGEYKFFSAQIQEELDKSLIKEQTYITRKSVNGIAYIVNLKQGMMTQLEDEADYPYIYITEF